MDAARRVWANEADNAEPAIGSATVAFGQRAPPRRPPAQQKIASLHPSRSLEDLYFPFELLALSPFAQAAL
jgi:hypothetical protein